MEEQNRKGPIQSVSRAAAILRCFYGQRELSLQEICQQVGLHKSTTATLIATLKNEQLLEQDPVNSKYRLGLGVFMLGAEASLDLRELALPYLEALNRQFRETVNLAAPADTNIVYIHKIESEYSMRTCTRIGGQLPFHCTANGKAIFAYYPADQLEKLLAHARLQPMTRDTVVDADTLRRELQQVRQEGYAMENGQLEPGLCCYAAPVFDFSGVPAAAISISGPAVRMQEKVPDGMVTELKRCAGEISRLLGQVRYVAAKNSAFY